MTTRRAKPVKNYDAVQITNLEDDFEEFALDTDRVSSQKFKTTPTFNSGNVKQTNKGSPLRTNMTDDAKSSAKSNVSKRSHIHLGKFSSDIEGPDAVWKKGPTDSVSSKNNLDTLRIEEISSKAGNRQTPLSNGAQSNETLRIEDISSKAGTRQTSVTNGAQPNTNISASQPTQTQQPRNYNFSSLKKDNLTSSKVNQSPLSSSRSTTTTPLNQRAPVSSVQVKKRVNKNEKAFGHDAQDMFIDDIEDF